MGFGIIIVNILIFLSCRRRWWWCCYYRYFFSIRGRGFGRDWEREKEGGEKGEERRENSLNYVFQNQFKKYFIIFLFFSTLNIFCSICYYSTPSRTHSRCKIHFRILFSIFSLNNQ